MLVACSEHLIGATGLRKPEIGVPGSVLSLVGNSGINTGNKCWPSGSRYQKRNSGKHKFGGENKFEVTAVLQILRELTYGWKEGCCVIEKKFGGGGARVWRKIKLSVTAIFMYIGEVLMSTVRVCVFPALNIFTSTLEVWERGLIDIRVSLEIVSIKVSIVTSYYEGEHVYMQSKWIL